MNRPTIILLLILTLTLTACSGSTPNAAGPAGNVPGGGAAGELSAPMQVALGTIKLDGTENAITADQAKELLPLWETLQQMEGSDTAATQEKEALVSQIQETMSQTQMQAITALGLTRQDMFSIMQSQGQAVGGTRSNSNTQSGSTSTNRGFGPGGGGFGGPPPDGGFGGNPNFQGQRSQSQSGTSTGGTSSNQPAAIDPNRIPTPLIQAVIDYLKTKAGG
jgi:hypothetical protein